MRLMRSPVASSTTKCQTVYPMPPAAAELLRIRVHGTIGVLSRASRRRQQRSPAKVILAGLGSEIAPAKWPNSQRNQLRV